MARMYNWGDTDWYSTVSYIFAGDDERTLPTKRLVEIFEYYYNKFYTRTSNNDIYLKAIKSILHPSLAEEMFSQKGMARLSFESMLPKQVFFTRMMQSFKAEEQYEILRRLFDEKIYIDDGYDTKYLQMYIGGTEYEAGLVRRYEQLLKSSAIYIDEKRDILNNLLRELEPLRDSIKKSLGAKYDIIFSMGNKLHIRHNNKEGANKNEVAINMSNRELVSKYNDLFMLIKTVMNLLNDKTFYKHYDERERIITEFKELNKDLKKK